MKNSNENIIFYRSWWDSLATKSPDFRHSVLDAVFAFAFEEISPSFPTESGQQIAYETIASYIEKNREKFAAKKAAADARWQKVKEAKQCTTMQSDAQRCTTMQSDGRAPAGSVDKDKDNVKDNVKDKDNVSKEIDTLSLSHSNKNISSAEALAERERVIFDYALFLLAEGRVNAYGNATAAWDYNEALDWKRETERRDGSVVHQPIRYKLSWLKNREQKPPQEFSAEHGALLAAILRRTGMLQENHPIIDDFRGFGIRDGCVYFLYARISKAVQIFSRALSDNPKYNNIVSQELQKAFPDSQTFAIINKNDF